MTNKLLLEAGLGSTYYQWGGREEPSNPNDLVQMVNLTQTIAPGCRHVDEVSVAETG
jgi:hypothetical protein